MDKIISEFKIIETDDGFRIEVKGDKDLMRKMLSHRFGKGRLPFGHHFPFGHGFFGGMGRHWCGPWEEQAEEKPSTP